MDGYLGTLLLFAGNFPPRNWMFCQGQLLPISQNAGLFALIGTTYGGDGTKTFALPDLRGRVPVGVGQGQGLPNVVQGEKAGAPTVTLGLLEIPSHNHVIDMKSAGVTLNMTATGTIKAGAAANAALEHRRDHAEAEPVAAASGASDLPVFAAKRGDYASRSGVEHGHHVRSDAARLRVLDGGDRLVQPLCVELETVEPARRQLLPGGPRRGVGPREAGGVQHRSGDTVHECDVREPAPRSVDRGEHGRPRSRVGQCVHRAVVEKCEVSGNLFEGVRDGGRCGRRAAFVL